MSEAVLAHNAAVFSKMSFEELIEASGVTDVTRDTYLYVDDAGTLSAIEKRDRYAQPADEYESIGYVSSWKGGVPAAQDLIANR